MFLAHHVDRSLLKFHQLLHDGKSESGTTIAACNTGIRLTETFKDGVQFFFWNSDTCVRYFNPDPASSAVFFFRGAGNLNRSGVGKLNRVADEVDQDLIETNR